MSMTKRAVYVSELIHWVYEGDFPAKAVIITETRLLVLSEGFDEELVTHIWELDDEGSVVVDVELEDDGEVHFDPYHGSQLLADPETIKGTSFEDFMEIVKKYQ